MRRLPIHSAWFRLGAGLGVALLLAALSAGWWLPTLAEAILRRELAKRGCAVAEIRVASVSPTRAELGPVALGRGADVFRIETVRLTYSLSGLARGRLKTVEIAGLQATVFQRGAAWRLAGYEPVGAQYTAVAKAPATPRTSRRLPFASLDIRSSTIQVQTASGEVRTTVDVTGAANASGAVLEFGADLYPEGQRIRVHGNLDQDTRSGMIAWEAQDLDLVLCFEKLVKPFVPAGGLPEFRIAGRLAASGQIDVARGILGPIEFTAQSADLLLGWGKAQMRLAPLRVAFTAPAGLASLSATASGTVGETVHGASRYGGEAPLGEFDATGSALARGKVLETSGVLRFRPNITARKALFPGKSLEFAPEGPRLCGVWNARRESGKPWSADLDLTFDEKVSVTAVLPPVKLSGQVRLVVLGSFDGDRLAASATASITNLVGEIAGTTIAASEVGLWAALPPTAVSDPESGLGAVLDNGVQGQLILAGGAFRRAAYGNCAELNVSLPFSWSVADGLRTPQSADGTPPIRWRGLVMQAVRLADGVAGLSVTDSAARFEARLAPENSALAANLVAQASWAQGPVAKLEVEVPPVLLTEKEPLLAARLQAFPGATCALQVGGRVRIEARPGTPLQASGRVVVEKGDFAYPAMTLSVKGIAGTVELASLRPLRTPPAQRLVFSAAEVAGMPVDGGTIVFQVESPESVFIEKGDISWAGGWLRGYAFRFHPTQPNGEVVLYADAIDLARFLRSFKNFKGQGSGILYGRLPFRVHNGLVRFANGFLISVPGQPGHLKLTEQDWLVTALDQTGMDATTLARVKEALTDFDFSVFRMDLETGDPQGAVLRTRLVGKGTKDPRLPPLDLEVNLHGPLDSLFNMGLRLAK